MVPDTHPGKLDGDGVGVGVFVGVTVGVDDAHTHAASSQ